MIPGRLLRQLVSQRSLRRTPLPVGLAVLVSLVPIGLTKAAFTGTQGRTASAVSQAVYACGVDYASTVTATSGLVNYWRLGETSGSTAVDQTGSANGTYAGSPVLGGAAAKPTSMGANGSVRFDDGYSQFVNVGDVNDFAGTTPFTIEAWVKVSATNTGTIAAKSSGVIDGWFFAIKPDGRLSFARHNNNTLAGFLDTAEPLSVGVWHHVVAVSTNSAVTIYVDGRIPRTMAAGSVTALPDTNLPFRIGASYDSNNPSATYYSMIGSIDEVAVYNRALTPDEVQSHSTNCTYASVVSRTPGLQSYWRLDETSGPTAADSGPAGVTGTYFNAPTLAATGLLPSTTRTAPSLSKPSTQAVNVGNNYGFYGNSTFTVEAWVKPASVDPSFFRAVVSAGSGNSPRNEWTLFVTNSNRAEFQRWTAGTLTGVSSAPSSVPVGVSTHLVATYDGANLRLYLNGVYVTSAPSPGSLTTATTDLRIGNMVNVANRSFDGTIDEVAIYNRALTGVEVGQHFDAR